MFEVSSLLIIVSCWKNSFFTIFSPRKVSLSQILSVKTNSFNFPKKNNSLPRSHDPLWFNWTTERCNLIKAGPKSVIHPSSGGGNRLQVHLSPSNPLKLQTPVRSILSSVSNTRCLGSALSVSGISHNICSLSRSKTCLWNTQNRQTRGGDEFISPLSTLLKCSCVACKRNKEKKKKRWWWWVGEKTSSSHQSSEA